MIWWKWLLFGGIALVLVGTALIAVKEKPKISCRDRVPAPTIVAFGDSLVAGQGATTRGGFVTLVARNLGLPIENFGRSGDTAESAKARLAAATAAQPDVVIVLLGGNDALRRTPAPTTERNLDEMLTTFRQADAEVVLLGVVGGLPFQDPYPAMYKRLAEKHDAIYVSDVLAGLIGRTEYMSDSIHPNEAGYERIAARVLPAVEEACGRLD